MKTFWISYCRNGFLGVVITDAPTAKEAIRKVDDLGINPGGQAAAFDLSAVGAVAHADALGRDRLILEPELLAHGHGRIRDDEPAMQRFIMQHAGVTLMCEECNKPSGTCHCE